MAYPILRQGNIVRTFEAQDGSKRKVTLMQEDYVQMIFTLDEPFVLHIGDYTSYNNEFFEVLDVQKPERSCETGGYEYNITFEAQYRKFKNKILKYRPSFGGKEASFSLTATIGVFINLLTANTDYYADLSNGYKYQRRINYTFVVDDGVKTGVMKPLTFSNTSILDAFTAIAEAFETEWYVVGSVIHFGKCESGTAVDFKLFDNVEKMSRSESSDSYVRRIYAFGSTRNISDKYRRSLVFNANASAELTDGTDYIAYLTDVNRGLDITMFPINDVELSAATKIKFTSPSQSQIVPNRVPKGATIDFRKVLGDSPYPITVKLQTQNVTPTELMEAVVTKDSPVVINDTNSTALRIVISYDNSHASSFDFENYVYINPEYNVYTDLDLYINNNVTHYHRVRMSKALTGSEYWWFEIVFDGSVDAETAEANRDALIAAIEAGNVAYKLPNVIQAKVPAAYFSADESDVIVTGGVAERRLMLPLYDSEHTPAYPTSLQRGCIEDGDNLPEDEAVEAVVVFDDIYPHTDYTVSEVRTTTIYDEYTDSDGNKVKTPVSVYCLKVNGLIFDKSYILPGKDLQVVFSSGNLSGMTFAVKFHEAGTIKDADGNWIESQCFEVVRNEDYGTSLPTSNYCPAVNDKFALIGMDTAFVDATLVGDAEDDLLTAAQDYLEKSKVDPSTYDCTMMASDVVNNGLFAGYQLGQRVTLINDAYFAISRASRIIGYEIDVNQPVKEPVYSVGESVAYSRLKALEEKVDSIEVNGVSYSYAGGTSGGGSSASVYIITTTDSTEATDANVYSAAKTKAMIGALEAEVNNKQDALNEDEIAAIRSGIDMNKVEDYDRHLGDYDNPHRVTKAQVGLGNVDNTSDVNKPISMAQQAAINNLQSEIDATNATQNVIDIVATKAALDAYVTTNVRENDKIEVLADESQDNANTIYEWRKVNNVFVWSLVGAKAAYYSKAEMDASLANKEDKSNKVTSLSPSSTDAQYPSAKTVYDAIDSSLTEEIPDDFIDTLVGDSDVDFWLTIQNGEVVKENVNTPPTNLSNIFANNTNLTEVLAAPKTYNVSNIYAENLFMNCTNLKFVPNDMFDGLELNNFQNVFRDCQKLVSIPPITLSRWATSLSQAFWAVPAPRLNITLNAETKIIKISFMCYGGGFIYISPLRIDYVTDMSSAFRNAATLRYLSLIGFGTQESINISRAFSGCDNWGSAYTDNEITITKAEAEQSVIDTFYTFSFDRATAGYTTLDVTIPRNVYDILNNTTNTDTGNTFLADATAKGYTFAIQG